MCRGGDDVGVLYRVSKETGSDESGRVSHIDHQDSAYAICDLTHALVVPLTRVGRGTTDDELRVGLLGLALHIVVVDTTVLLTYTVGNGVVEDTGGVDEGPVGQVTAVIEVETHEGVAGVEASLEDRHIGLSAGVRLHVGILSIVELLDAIDSQLLALIHDLTATIVALAGIALSVLVGHDATHSAEHLFANEVL